MLTIKRKEKSFAHGSNIEAVDLRFLSVRFFIFYLLEGVILSRIGTIVPLLLLVVYFGKINHIPEAEPVPGNAYFLSILHDRKIFVISL